MEPIVRSPVPRNNAVLGYRLKESFTVSSCNLPRHPLPFLIIVMSPSTTQERRPSVHERHNVTSFPSHGVPVTGAVVDGLAEEPEIGRLFSLRGSSAIVTGGARGLGVTIAAACVESGADVLCCDILSEPSQPEWSAMESKAKRHSAQVSYVRLDIVMQIRWKDASSGTASRPDFT